MAVTGFVLPAQLETYAQRYFEDIYGGMGKGFRPRTFRRSNMDEGQLLWASGFGVGANMAFRRGLFEKVGLFDPALDVGTETRGGGDVEFFHRVVARGHLCVMNPKRRLAFSSPRDGGVTAAVIQQWLQRRALSRDMPPQSYCLSDGGADSI